MGWLVPQAFVVLSIVTILWSLRSLFPIFFLPIFALQVQIAALMQLQGAGADPEQLERMQSMLSQKNSEIEALMTKVRQLEADQVGLIFGFIVSCWFANRFNWLDDNWMNYSLIWYILTSELAECLLWVKTVFKQ